VEMSKRQTEFWVAMLVLCIIVATAILLVDFGIKSAILQESNRLRLTIEGELNGRVAKTTNAGRATNKSADDPPYPSDVLVVNSPGMEAGSADNGDKAPGGNARKRRAQPSRQTSSRTIPGGDK